MSTRTVRLWLASGVIVLLAAIVAVVGAVSGGPAEDRAAPPAATSSPAAGAAGALQDPVAASAQSSHAASATRISIPALGIRQSLEKLSTDDAGHLLPPVDFSHIGWFAAGTVPGDVGPAVIAAHTDSTGGPGVFAHLDRLRVGDRIAVTRSDGSTATFRVTRTENTQKAHFDTADVYGPVPTAQLRLITCSGSLDPTTGLYLDNLVVFAELEA